MTNEVIRVFIGYDNRIPVASTALMHSITTRSSKPVSFNLLNINQLQKSGLYTREASPLQSTEFSFSRFLTPYLSGFEGWSIFMDNDMIVLEDIANLWNLRDDKYSVMCVQHQHKPSEAKKFMGAVQTSYEKKNWSSVILFNNAKCKILTPEYANKATGLELHQFKWLGDDKLIGEIPHKWNHLVDYDESTPAETPALLHYTIGGPFYPDYVNCSYSAEWFREFAGANHCKEADYSALTEAAKTKISS